MPEFSLQIDDGDSFCENLIEQGTLFFEDEEGGFPTLLAHGAGEFHHLALGAAEAEIGEDEGDAVQGRCAGVAASGDLDCALKVEGGSRRKGTLSTGGFPGLGSSPVVPMAQFFQCW